MIASLVHRAYPIVQLILRLMYTFHYPRREYGQTAGVNILAKIPYFTFFLFFSSFLGGGLFNPWEEGGAKNFKFQVGFENCLVFHIFLDFFLHFSYENFQNLSGCWLISSTLGGRYWPKYLSTLANSIPNVSPRNPRDANEALR